MKVGNVMVRPDNLSGARAQADEEPESEKSDLVKLAILEGIAYICVH